MKTQVAIIGGGPAGLLLSEMLHRAGIDSVVLELRSRAHVLSRVRAGVLEQGTVEVLRANGLGERMDREGHMHDGAQIVWAGRESHTIDVWKHAGKRFIQSLNQLLLRMSSAIFWEKASIDITPRSWLPRARTATAPAAFSLSPTTRM